MIRCGYCKTQHETVAEVRRCAGVASRTIEDVEREMWEMEAAADRADTERDEAAKAAWKDSVETWGVDDQVAAMDARLAARERNWSAADRERAQHARRASTIEELVGLVRTMLMVHEVPQIDRRWSSAVHEMISGPRSAITEFALRTAIARLESYPRKIAPAPSAPGLYRKGDCLYQVVPNQQGTHLYAKLVTLPPVGTKARPKLTYAPGMISQLTEDDLVPAEEANEITRRTGWCVFGHFLTNPKSIARGMGPVCWAKYGVVAA